jgi:hypothetical protein
MSLQVRKLALRNLERVHLIPELSIRLESDGYPSHTKLYVYGPDEPLSVRYRGFVTVRGQGHEASGGTELVVTARRLVMLLMPAPKSAGRNWQAADAVLVSVDRADVCVPERKADFRGVIKQVDLVGSTDPFRIEVRASASLGKFERVMSPDWAQRLGPEAAAERREAKRLEQEAELEEAQLAAQERKQAEAKRFADATERGILHENVPSGKGILDHLKTWHYKVAASPDRCVTAFMNAFSGPGGLLARAKWSVEQVGDGAVARYQGRKGIVNALTAFSDMAQAEEASAIGSEVKFRIEAEDESYTTCSMWLASRSTRLGFTNDARFFKPYMRAVESQLRTIDPALKVVRD